METLHLQTVIAPDGMIRLEVPSSLPPGPADVVLVVSSAAPPAPRKSLWRDVRGLGKEIWAGQDAQDYVNRLRDEWER